MGARSSPASAKTMEEKKKLNEQLNELGDVLEDSNRTIEEYKNDNNDLWQKIWKAIKKIQSRDEELEEKVTEIETAYEVIEELKSRMMNLGADLRGIGDD